ncbi:MAG: serine/threonine protein kinase [Polyangiaceae bacterium]|nr:serine/threonine protein kinase [Polyangiaceae bacterium]
MAHVQPATSSRPPAGGVLGGYELLERLGAGGMAEVWVARRRGPHGFVKRVAIKRILPQLARDARFVEMFCDEARVYAALAHPNLVQILDFGEADGELYMALEYVGGPSVARLLRLVGARSGRVPLEAACFIAREVLRGLHAAHSAVDDRGRPLGLVHRDVSPGNVLIGRAGEVKLTDFGIARGAFIERRTCPGEMKGKLGYMSPEQVVGSEVDPRTDLFSAGVVLAELCLTRPLFAGRSELEILTRIHRVDLGVLERHGGSLPERLRAILVRALQRSADRRFGSAGEMLSELESFAGDAGLDLDEATLAPWLAAVGALPSSSGVQEAVRPVAEPPPRPAPAPAPRASLPTLPDVPPEDGGAPGWEATVERVRAPALLYSIARSRRSARIEASAGGETVAVRVADGALLGEPREAVAALARWLGWPSAEVRLFLDDADAVPRRGGEPFAAIVTRGVRAAWAAADLAATLGPYAQERVASVMPRWSDPRRLGLVGGELPSLELCAGASSLGRAVAQLEARGVASSAEAMRAVFVGLSAGLLSVRGWRRTA